VISLSSWKYSFEIVNRELDLTKKKREALDDLFESKRISETTHQYLEKELTAAIIDLEAHQKTLLDKMDSRNLELENQVNSLEIFLANLEIHHVTGEIDEETYEKQNSAIMLGLSATKDEIATIRNSINKISGGTSELEVFENQELLQSSVKESEKMSEDVEETLDNNSVIEESQEKMIETHKESSQEESNSEEAIEDDIQESLESTSDNRDITL
jgi:hypothetical protein